MIAAVFANLIKSESSTALVKGHAAYVLLWLNHLAAGPPAEDGWVRYQDLLKHSGIPSSTFYRAIALLKSIDAVKLNKVRGRKNRAYETVFRLNT